MSDTPFTYNIVILTNCTFPINKIDEHVFSSFQLSIHPSFPFFIHSSNYLFINPSNYPFIHLSNYPFIKNLSTYPFIQLYMNFNPFLIVKPSDQDPRFQSHHRIHSYKWTCTNDCLENRQKYSMLIYSA